MIMEFTNINSSVGDFKGLADRHHTDLIVVHSAATKADHKATIGDIHQWHLDRGWAGVGYHFVIERDGTLHVGRPLDKVGAHIKGLNSRSIGICMVGGLSDDGKKQVENFKFQQYETLQALLLTLQTVYPKAEICKHKDYADTMCNEVDFGRLDQRM